jgi:hypothetical protein
MAVSYLKRNRMFDCGELILHGQRVQMEQYQSAQLSHIGENALAAFSPTWIQRFDVKIHLSFKLTLKCKILFTSSCVFAPPFPPKKKKTLSLFFFKCAIMMMAV